MTDIYQLIWNADQGHNGIPAVKPGETTDADRGFVIVDEKEAQDEQHRVLKEVSIPQDKSATYAQCRKLFDNYALDQRKAEVNTPEEDVEVRNLLEAVIDSPPMETARQIVAERINEPVSQLAWYQMVWDVWFRQFDQGANQDLSGFEHVIVGEQKQGKAQGYHFWYKYHLDDSIEFLGKDDIRYGGTAYRGPGAGQGTHVPEVVTISYRWEALDYDTGQRRPLTKPIGGFWVGCSIEGMLALGTVRCLRQAAAPKEAVINDARYKLRLFRSADGRSMRTFYPEFAGLAESGGNGNGDGNGNGQPPPETAGAVRIIAALVNPSGEEAGSETVTLLNRSPAAVSLNGWELEDKANRRERIQGQSIPAGGVATIRLSGETSRLGNQGGVITLFNAAGERIDGVNYTKAQAKKQDWTVVF